MTTPPGFKDAWKKFHDMGLSSFAVTTDAGGYGGPSAIDVLLKEVLSGANTAFNMYPGLTHGAADVPLRRDETRANVWDGAFG